MSVCKSEEVSQSAPVQRRSQLREKGVISRTFYIQASVTEASLAECVILCVICKFQHLVSRGASQVVTDRAGHPAKGPGILFRQGHYAEHCCHQELTGSAPPHEAQNSCAGEDESVDTVQEESVVSL